MITIDINLDGAGDWALDDFQEAKHPRAKGGHHGGQFVRKGMSGAGQAVQRAAGKVASKTRHVVAHHAREMTERDHRILRQHLYRANSAPRRTLGNHIRHIGKSLPRLLAGHLREEKQNAIHAVGALKQLGTGKRPTPEQMKGLRAFGMRVLLSAGSMALMGDATGTVPVLATKLGHEIIQHVVLEHTAALGGGALRTAVAAFSAPKDAEMDLTAEDYKLLQQFVERLAKAAVDMPISTERAQQLLSGAGNGTTNDAWEEGKHPRGQPENAGEFTSSKGGATAKKPAEKKSQLVAAHPDRAQWPEHIKKLRLPPAWKDVQISQDPKSPLQAIGVDAKGRKQYVYSSEFSAKQSAQKFARIVALQKALPAIEQRNAANQKSDNAATREHADAVALIMQMGIRPGSEEDTHADKKAYGATTLEGQHVVTNGKEVRLQFIGKKGVAIDLPVTDPALAKMLVQRSKQTGPGGQLFPSISAGSLLNYVHKLEPKHGFKTKDFRTLLATKTANSMVTNASPPKTAKEYKKAVMDVAKAVSSKLGNTPTVALQSYINPVVFAPWQSSLSPA